MLRLVFERLEKILRSKRNYKFFLKDWSHLTDLDQVTTAFETMSFVRKLEPFVTERANGHHVVVIAPHADDDIFGCGGTLLKHRAAGGSLTTIYLSLGKPKEESDLREEIATCRETLGSKSVFLDFPLNNFQMTEEAVAAFKYAVVEAQPDALFIPAFTDDHDDHRHANEYLLRAFRNDRALNFLIEVGSVRGAWRDLCSGVKCLASMIELTTETIRIANKHTTLGFRINFLVNFDALRRELGCCSF